jgi:hypothetical protein
MAPLNFNKLNKIETIFQLTITYVCKALVVQGCHFVTIDGNDLCVLYINFHCMKNMCMFLVVVHPIVFDQCSTFKIWKRGLKASKFVIQRPRFNKYHNEQTINNTSLFSPFLFLQANEHNILPMDP